MSSFFFFFFSAETSENVRPATEHLDQPVHLQGLIRILTRRILGGQESKIPSYGQWRLWSDYFLRKIRKYFKMSSAAIIMQHAKR